MAVYRFFFYLTTPFYSLGAIKRVCQSKSHLEKIQIIIIMMEIFSYNIFNYRNFKIFSLRTLFAYFTTLKFNMNKIRVSSYKGKYE